MLCPTLGLAVKTPILGKGKKYFTQGLGWQAVISFCRRKISITGGIKKATATFEENLEAMVSRASECTIKAEENFKIST
ncbi:hypothetical protein DD601_14965 [Enterobacter cloacae]|nr:hypothetical protein DD601_14965 [Enterobacter cloacae]